MIKFEFLISTLLLSAFGFGFIFGLIIMYSLLDVKHKKKLDGLNQQITKLKVQNTELQGKVDSDLRLLREIRRK